MLSKNINDALVNLVASHERHCWKNAQYSRSECVKIKRIPLSVDHSHLSKQHAKFCNTLLLRLEGEGIESFYRLNEKAIGLLPNFLEGKTVNMQCVLRKILKIVKSN